MIPHISRTHVCPSVIVRDVPRTPNNPLTSPTLMPKIPLIVGCIACGFGIEKYLYFSFVLCGRLAQTLIAVGRQIGNRRRQTNPVRMV